MHVANVVKLTEDFIKTTMLHFISRSLNLSLELVNSFRLHLINKKINIDINVYFENDFYKNILKLENVKLWK